MLTRFMVSRLTDQRDQLKLWWVITILRIEADCSREVNDSIDWLKAANPIAQAYGLDQCRMTT